MDGKHVLLPEGDRDTEEGGSRLGGTDTGGLQPCMDETEGSVLVQPLESQGLHTNVEITTRASYWAVGVEILSHTGAKERISVKFPRQEGNSGFTLRLM